MAMFTHDYSRLLTIEDAMFLFWPVTSKGESKGCYTSVLFEVPDLKRSIICIILGRAFLVHLLRIFMRTYFLSTWASRVQPNALLASIQCMEKGGKSGTCAWSVNKF